jgi:hypothetical protein
MLAVPSNLCLRFLTDEGLIQTDPAALAEMLDAAAWSTPCGGRRLQGAALYDWADISLPWVGEAGFGRWVLIRRNRRDPDKLACYLAFAPKNTALAELAGAAGLRWTIEECFQRAKDDLGLDHCEARS